MDQQIFNEATSSLPKLSVEQTEEYVPAGFWVRFFASFIDNIVVSLFLFPLNVLSAVMKLHEGAANIIVSNVLFYICYYTIVAWFITKKGGLPGKLLFGLRIIDVKTGSFLAPGKAIFRESIGKFLSAIILLIGFIMAGIRSDKKALHDVLSGTQVIQKVKTPKFKK